MHSIKHTNALSYFPRKAHGEDDKIREHFLLKEITRTMFSLNRVLTSALLKDDEDGEHIILLMVETLKYYYYAMAEF